MKILITGGAGFIGSHLVRKLQSENVQFIVVDNLSTGSLENLPENVSFVNLDIRKPELWDLMEKEKFDAVVHFAAQTMVNISIDDPVNDMDENVHGTVNVLEGAKNTGIKRIVFSSTAAAYGDVTEEQLPVKENELLQPMSFYGLSKVTAEKYLAMYHLCFGLDYVVLRFANVYGERQGNGGEGGVISIFGKQIAQDKQITIFGDGGQTRDFIYAGDIANGVWAALNTKNVNTVYNLSTQKETSLLEMIKIFEQVSGKKINPAFVAERVGDIYRSSLCNEKAKSGLDWDPQVTLKDGLKRTYQYFNENFK